MTTESRKIVEKTGMCWKTASKYLHILHEKGKVTKIDKKNNILWILKEVKLSNQ